MVLCYGSPSKPKQYSRDRKTYVHIKISTQIFLTTLFITFKKWKQPKYPSTDEWKNKI